MSEEENKYRDVKTKCSCEFNKKRHWGNYAGIGIVESARRLGARIMREEKVTADSFPIALDVVVNYGQDYPAQKITLEYNLMSKWTNPREGCGDKEG